MKTLLKNILIFGVIGAIIGAILGPIIILANLGECPVVNGKMTACMGSLLSYIEIGLLIGLLIGIVIGLFVGIVKTKK